MLIAADDALTSAVEAKYLTSRKVDKKFGEVIDLLSRFERDFKDSMSGPRIAHWQTVTREANFKSPSVVLHALKKNLRANVKCSYVFLFPNTDERHESQPMSNKLPEPTRIVDFYILRFLPDTRPIVVKRECHASMYVVLGI